jgi:hypothetical protein
MTEIRDFFMAKNLNASRMNQIQVTDLIGCRYRIAHDYAIRAALTA